jgi:capsular polysaccharide biosynthesis protein
MTVYEAEIDLRPYILSITRNWWKIALLVLLAAIVAVAISLIRPKEYEATATILITRTRPSLSLAQQFPTVSEPVDSASRLNAYLSIIKSDELVMNSIEVVKDQLPIEKQNLKEFREMVSISSSGDAILIKATANDPELAARIANEWAEQAVLSINAAYSGEQLPTKIQSQLNEAFIEYDEAQTGLEAFLEASQKSVLQKQLFESETLLNSLTNNQAWQIAYFTQRIQEMDQIISQAEGLRQQLEGGSESRAARIGDAIAVLQVRASAFGINLAPVVIPQSTSEESSATNPVINVATERPQREPVSIDLQYSELSSLTETQENYEPDLENLIALARAEKSKAENILLELSQGILQNQPPDLIQQAATQVQLLTAQLEQVDARENELLSHRDLTWKAYQALAEKETELRNASQASNQVSLATLAVPPQEASSGGLILNTAIAVVISLIVGTVIVMGSYWWRNSVLAPGIERSSPAVDLK